MPRTTVVYFKDDDGSVPVLEFLASVPDRAKVKIIAKIDRLRELGYEMRRPEADYLQDGIYELRTKLGHVNYRVLYFFHGNAAVVLSHGLTKESEVPQVEIDRAIDRKLKFTHAARAHTYIENEG